MQAGDPHTIRPIVEHRGAGSTVAMTVPYAFYGPDEIQVRERTIATGATTPLTRGVHYSVTGGDGSPGTVVPMQTVPVTTSWIIARATARSQALSITDGAAFPARAFELALDRVVAIIQEDLAASDLVLRLPLDGSPPPAPLPPANLRAGKFLGADQSGNVGFFAAAIGGVPVTTFAATLLDDVDATTARQTLGIATDSDRRNLLLNGDFGVNARELSSFTGANGNCIDRWFVMAAGGSRSVARRAATSVDRQAIGADIRHVLVASVAGGTSTDHFESLSQHVEFVHSLSARTATASFWVRRTAGAGNVAVELSQFFGSGGSPSTSVLAIGATLCTVSASWQRCTVTTPVPSTAGKTLGSQGNDYLNLTIWLSASSDTAARAAGLGVQSATFEVAATRLEEGAFASPCVVPRPSAEELDCARYYTRIQSAQFLGYDTGGASSSDRFPVPMRRVPSVQISTSGVVGRLDRAGFPPIDGATVASVVRDGVRVVEMVGSLVAGGVYRCLIEADAEL